MVVGIPLALYIARLILKFKKDAPLAEVGTESIELDAFAKKIPDLIFRGSNAYPMFAQGGMAVFMDDSHNSPEEIAQRTHDVRYHFCQRRPR